MKRFISILSGLLLAAVIGLAQGKWEQSGVSQYGTGGINLSGERIDNSYNAGKFNSEQKSTSKNNPYVYFRKGQFSVPAKTYNPGATVTVSMNISVKRHSGNGTPKGSAGAVLVNGKAGQGTSVPTQVKVSGKDASKSGSATLTVPTHSAAGNNFSIVYSCFDITVVYLYRWVEDKPVEKQPAPAAEPEAPTREEPAVEKEPDQPEGIVMPDDTILPLEDEPTADTWEEQPEESVEDALAEAAKALQGDNLTGEAVKKALKKADTDTVLSLLGFDLTKKDLIMYGIIAGLGLLVLILLLVLIFRKNPAKKAAKQEAKKAAAEAKAAAKAEAAEKAAAAKAAAAEKAAAMKAEREAKLAEQKAKQEEQKAAAAEKAAAAKAAQEAKAAELKQKQEAAKAEREAKLAEQKAAAAEKAAAAKAAQEAKAAELKQKQEAAKAEREAKLAEQKAKKEAVAAAAAAKAAAPKPAEEPKPAGKRFCENCGAPLAPDAAFCENCGTKVS